MRIRSAGEIVATLDADGKLDGMPFMPEMLAYCGQTVEVASRADKACDTTHHTGLRRLHDTVHLAGLRCDGSAHGGCQAGCLLFWKEQWLQPVDAGAREATSRRSDPAHGDGLSGSPGDGSAERDRELPSGEPQSGDVERLARLATVEGDAGASTAKYVCQATELFAASSALPWWEPTQYVRDIRTRNATVAQVLMGIVRWLLVRVQWRVNRSGVPFVKGRLERTPRATLDLSPGERVRVKTAKEIERTLSRSNRNRGLAFDADMLNYCGGEFRVLRRIDRIIDERTGTMVSVPGDCIVLDGVTCKGSYNRCCPRSDYPYWREIWLERLNRDGTSTQAVAQANRVDVVDDRGEPGDTGELVEHGRNRG